MPKVTVLLSAFNAESYIELCIKSLLYQSFEDYEILIINDGSTDNTEAICRSFTDPRVRVHNNDRNEGLIYSLNKGIALANSPLIARMDADDIAFKFRLESQVTYLDEHPEVGAVASWMIPVDSRGKPIKNFTKLPSEPEYISWALLFKNPIANPSATFRKALVEQLGGYQEGYPVAQDYELWSRLHPVQPVHILPEYSVLYRVHNKNIGVERKTEQETKAVGIAQRNMSNLLGERVDYDEAQVLFYAGKGYRTDASLTLIHRAADLLSRLYEAHEQQFEINDNVRGYMRHDIRFIMRQLLLSVDRPERRGLIGIHPVIQETMNLSLYSHLWFDWRKHVGALLRRPAPMIRLAASS